MKYLCLISAPAQKMMEGLSPVDAARHFEEYRDFTNDIRAAATSSPATASNRRKPPPPSASATVRS